MEKSTKPNQQLPRTQPTQHRNDGGRTPTKNTENHAKNRRLRTKNTEKTKGGVPNPVSRRLEVIEEISDLTDSDHGATRKRQLSTSLVFDIRNLLGFDPELASKKAVLIELEKQDIIKTNQDLHTGCSKLGLHELRQLQQHLKKFVHQ